ncbi:phosphohydrolase [Ectothiorhodospiraceae bacterium WFHF3C12]|nr:phosphohydrolase [Ectothiorhodospiraceae bacterium WFHF3C12]
MPRKGSWNLTYTGRRFYPWDPRPEDIDILDIAHHLACLNRFNGALARPYSVAQHSVVVARAVPAEHQLTGLLHDATEAYVGDMVRPVKRDLHAYQLLEARVWDAVAARFDLPSQLPECVKHADDRAAAAEAAQLYGHARAGLFGASGQLPLDVSIEPLEWHQAKAEFLSLYEELTASGETRALS